VRRLWFVIVLVLAACQPQASATAKATSTPVSPPGDLIYVQDPTAPRMLELDWSGKAVGWVAAQGFGGASQDGSRFLHAGDQLVVEDWRGHVLGKLDLDPSSYGLSVWADDGVHLCGITFPPNAGPDSGQGRLWVGAPGETGRFVGPVGQAGSDAAVMTCSLRNNRAIVASNLMPHWPPGATRYLITADIQVINLTSGAIEYQHQYPLGNLGGQLEVGPRGDWVLVSASPDGRYLAESGVFNGTTIIRDASTGKQLSSLPGSVIGFSSDGSRVVANIGSGGSAEAQVLTWTDERVLWHASGIAQATQARPDSTDILIGMALAGGNASDLVVVRRDGSSSIVVWNGSGVRP